MWSSLLVTLCLGLYGQTAASAQASIIDTAILDANGSQTVADSNKRFDPTAMRSTTIAPQVPSQIEQSPSSSATASADDGVCVLAGSDQGIAASFAPPVRLTQDHAIVVCSRGYSAEVETDRPASSRNSAIVTVDNADGSSTETVTEYGATNSDVIAVKQTTVSADGLTTTIDSDFTGPAGVADGSWDQISVDQTVVNADGGLTETTTVSDGNGHVLDQTIKTTSADRKTVTTTTTQGTTGLVKQVETITTQSNGSIMDSVVNFDEDGDVLSAVVTTTSADGLTKIVQDDIQGQTAAAYAAGGLSFDSTTTETTVINADGSRTETTNVTSQNGTLVSTSTVTTSANGLSITTTENPYATAHYAHLDGTSDSIDAAGTHDGVNLSRANDRRDSGRGG